MKNLKSVFLISTIFLYSIIAVHAKTGVIDIIMRNSSSLETELITVQVEIHKFHSIVLVSQTGETITKTVKLTNQQHSINFDLPKGKYQLFIIDVENGIKQKYTTLLH